MATTTHWASTALWGFQQQVTTRPYTTAAISIVVVYVVGASIFSFVSRNPKVLYPEVRSESKAGLIYTIRALDWFKNGPRLIQDGYDKYRDTIFQVPSQDRTSIVLPARFLEEIRNLPSSIASNSRATSDVRSLPSPFSIDDVGSLIMRAYCCSSSLDHGRLSI